MFNFFGRALFIFTTVSATFLSDSGCSCVITKTTLTAPNASVSIAAGCSLKPDWLSTTSKWCLTDQVASPGCGTFQTNFGFVDTCTIAGFSSFNVSEPVYLSPDQTPTTFYTGQTLTVNWTTQRIAVDEWLRLTYTGQNLRTLTTGSGVNVTAGTFSARISDSNNAITPVGGSSLILSTTTTPVITASQNIIVLQSRITAANVFDGNRTVGGGSIICDNRNVTIQWNSIGQAGVGIATVTIRSNGGGGGTTVGTPQTVPVSPGNMTVNYILPRTFTPGGGGTTYSAQISVQSPGAGVTPYTLSSTSFTLVAAPSPTPSSTVSSSSTNTPSITPSPTQSVTSSQTPTPSITSSISQTPAPSVDYVGMAKAAATESEAKTTAIVGGAIGGLVGFVVICFVGFKLKQRHEAHVRRTRKLRNPRNYDEETRNVYGVAMPPITEGKTIMYQVTMPQQQRQSLGRGYQSNSSRRMTGRS